MVMLIVSNIDCWQLVEYRICIAEVMGSNPVEASEFVSGLPNLQLLQLLHNCEDHFHFYSSSVVHTYDLYHMCIISMVMCYPVVT